MDQELTFGVTTRQDLSWSDLVKRWRYIETLGFDKVFLPDHVVSVLAPKQPMMDSWTAIAALATQTERIRFGVHVTNVLFRNPILLTKQIVTVDHISNGRLELAFGSGNAAPSYGVAGIDAGTITERIARLSEVTELIDGLLRSDATTYEGRYYRVKDAVMYPAPVQTPRPPLAVAAHRAGALKVAAAYADTWDSFGGFGIPSEESLRLTRERSEKLDEFITSIGRDPRRIARSFFAGLTKDDLWSSKDAFCDFIGRYREIGITEFNFMWPRADQLGVFEQVASDVIPNLRASSPYAPPLTHR